MKASLVLLFIGLALGQFSVGSDYNTAGCTGQPYFISVSPVTTCTPSPCTNNNGVYVTTTCGAAPSNRGWYVVSNFADNNCTMLQNSAYHRLGDCIPAGGVSGKYSCTNGTLIGTTYTDTLCMVGAVTAAIPPICNGGCTLTCGIPLPASGSMFSLGYAVMASVFVALAYL